ncbi:hypothetical protein Bca4012_037830 [Brassica carinata]
MDCLHQTRHQANWDCSSNSLNGELDHLSPTRLRACRNSLYNSPKSPDGEMDGLHPTCQTVFVQLASGELDQVIKLARWRVGSALSISLSVANTANPRSDISTDDPTNRQIHDDGGIRDNVDKTPAVNASIVNAEANTPLFEEVKKMLSAFDKKSEEQDKLMGSLIKQNKTPTARTRDVLPRGTTRLHVRRNDFATPRDRPGNMQGNPSGKKSQRDNPCLSSEKL